MGLFDNYFSDLQSSFSSLPRKLGRKWFKTHRHPGCLYKELVHLPVNAKVLDVGCGPGNILRLFKELRTDLDYYGVDWSIPDSAASDKDVHFVSADFTKGVAFSAASFELITCYFVIEHIKLEDLEKFCKNIVSLLAPGGRLFITIPNPRSIHLDFYDDPTHIRPYTATAITKLFKPLGIETLKSGIDRSWKILFLAPFYRLLTLFKKDPSGISFFSAHLLGVVSYYLGRKK